MFSFTPLLRKTNRKTCPLSGRVLPCEGRGWKLRGDGVGMPYRFFPSPRVVEVKRTYCRVYKHPFCSDNFEPSVTNIIVVQEYSATF